MGTTVLTLEALYTPSLRQRIQLRHEREHGRCGRDGEDACQQQRQPQVADQVRQLAADQALHLQVQRVYLHNGVC